MIRKKAAPLPPTNPPEADPDDERMERVQQRPDGFHWIDVEGRQEFGPFDTLEEALADMDEPSDEAIEQAQFVEQTEEHLDGADVVDRLDEDEPEGAT